MQSPWTLLSPTSSYSHITIQNSFGLSLELIICSTIELFTWLTIDYNVQITLYAPYNNIIISSSNGLHCTSTGFIKIWKKKKWFIIICCMIKSLWVAINLDTCVTNIIIFPSPDSKFICMQLIIYPNTFLWTYTHWTAYNFPYISSKSSCFIEFKAWVAFISGQTTTRQINQEPDRRTMSQLKYWSFFFSI